MAEDAYVDSFPEALKKYDEKAFFDQKTNESFGDVEMGFNLLNQMDYDPVLQTALRMSLDDKIKIARRDAEDPNSNIPRSVYHDGSIGPDVSLDRIESTYLIPDIDITSERPPRIGLGGTYLRYLDKIKIYSETLGLDKEAFEETDNFVLNTMGVEDPFFAGEGPARADRNPFAQQKLVIHELLHRGIANLEKEYLYGEDVKLQDLDLLRNKLEKVAGSGGDGANSEHMLIQGRLIKPFLKKINLLDTEQQFYSLNNLINKSTQYMHPDDRETFEKIQLSTANKFNLMMEGRNGMSPNITSSDGYQKANDAKKYVLEFAEGLLLSRSKDFYHTLQGMTVQEKEDGGVIEYEPTSTDLIDKALFSPEMVYSDAKKEWDKGNYSESIVKYGVGLYADTPILRQAMSATNNAIKRTIKEYGKEPSFDSLIGFFKNLMVNDEGQLHVLSKEEGGVISLKDKAVNMNRGPRGIEPYVQYMEDGGEAKYEQGQGLGDVELRADLEPYLYGNPLARLGYELYKEGEIDMQGFSFSGEIGSYGVYRDSNKEIGYVANKRKDAPDPLRILTHELAHAAIAYLEGKDKADKQGFNQYGNVDYEESMVRGGDLLIDKRAPGESKVINTVKGEEPTSSEMWKFMSVSRAAQEELDNRGLAPEAVAEDDAGFHRISGRRIPSVTDKFKTFFGMDPGRNVNNYLNLTGEEVNKAEGGVISLKDIAVKMFEDGGEAQNTEETMPPELQGAYAELSQELIQDPRTGEFRYRTEEEILQMLGQFQSQDFLQDVASGGFQLRPSVQGGGSVTNKKSFMGTLDGEPMNNDIRVNQGGGRLGFEAVAPNKDQFGAGVSVYGSKGRVKNPEELEQFGVDRVQKFGSNKVNVGGIDAYYNMMNALTKGDSVRAGVNYNPNSEETNYNVNYNVPVKDLGIPALTQGAVNMYRRMVR